MSQERMARSGPRFKQWLRIGVSLALLGLLFSLLDLDRSLEIIGTAHVGFIGLVFALALAQKVLGAYRWHVLVRGQTTEVSFWTLLRLIFISHFLGFFGPGGVGQEVVRIYGLSRSTADIALSLSSVLIERFFALLALFALVLVGLAFAPFERMEGIETVAWAGLGLMIAAWTFLMHPRLRRLSDRLLGAAGLAPVRRILTKMYVSLDAYRGRRMVMVGALALAVAFQLIRIGMAVAGAAALGLDVSIWQFIVIMPVVVLITLLPISIGGLGVREASVVYFFGLVGVAAESAFTLGIMISFATIATSLPGAWFLGSGSFGRRAATPSNGGETHKTETTAMDKPDALPAPQPVKKTQAAVTKGGSAMRRYQDVVVGSRSLGRMLYFEWCAWLAIVPGAAGILLRSKFWPRLFGSCGRGVVFGSNVVLRHPHRIHFGDRVVISDNCVLDARTEDADCAIRFEDDIILSSNVILLCKGGQIQIRSRTGIGAQSIVHTTSRIPLSIGSDVMIGPRCYIVGGGNYKVDRTDVPIWLQGKEEGSVTIADDVWLGANVTVLSGASMGAGSIAAAGAVITKPVPDLAVCAGVPAKVIRTRGGDQEPESAGQPSAPAESTAAAERTPEPEPSGAI